MDLREVWDVKRALGGLSWVGRGLGGCGVLGVAVGGFHGSLGV